MNNITKIVLCLLFFSTKMLSQEAIITLEECQQKAMDNYPLIKQYDLIALSENYTLNNISKAYLPQISLNGQATYQSDVTKLSIDLSSLPLPTPISIPTMDKDQYKATLDVKQLVWDGGVTRSLHKVAKANSEIDKQQLEVTLYNIKDKINQLYFGVLAVDRQLEQLDFLETDMQANYAVSSSMFKNGVATQSDLDQLRVQLLDIEQNRTALLSTKATYLKMLSLFVQQDLQEDVKLKMPVEDAPLMTESISRPEQRLYTKQRSMLDARLSSITANNLPKISLFAQGGYGRPALNMLEPDFKFFGIGGVMLSWNFGSFYTKSNERKLIQANKLSVDVQESTFLFNTNMQLSEKDIELKKLRKMIVQDDEIIFLRNRVKTASESKYKNGVYQINELIRDVNAENQARQSKILHEIQYLLNIYNYKHIQGE